MSASGACITLALPGCTLESAVRTFAALCRGDGRSNLSCLARCATRALIKCRKESRSAVRAGGGARGAVFALRAHRAIDGEAQAEGSRVTAAAGRSARPFPRRRATGALEAPVRQRDRRISTSLTTDADAQVVHVLTRRARLAAEAILRAELAIGTFSAGFVLVRAGGEVVVVPPSRAKGAFKCRRGRVLAVRTYRAAALVHGTAVVIVLSSIAFLAAHVQIIPSLTCSRRFGRW